VIKKSKVDGVGVPRGGAVGVGVRPKPRVLRMSGSESPITTPTRHAQQIAMSTAAIAKRSTVLVLFGFGASDENGS